MYLTYIEEGRGWFSDVGMRKTAIKLRIAKTREWWWRFPPLLVY